MSEKSMLVLKNTDDQNIARQHDDASSQKTNSMPKDITPTKPHHNQQKERETATHKATKQQAAAVTKE